MHFNLLKELGKGSTSVVYSAVNNQSNALCAVKIIKLPEIPYGIKALQYATSEIRALSQLSHPNIIKLLSYEKTKIVQGGAADCVPTDALVLALEYAQNGQLFEYVQKNGPLSEKAAKPILNQILDGLTHIHSQGFAHLDLKLENILFDENMNVKIADFGVAYSLANGPSNIRVGSRPYMAPEINHGIVYNPVPADIFSLGVIMFVMLAGCYPFQSTDAYNRLFQLVLQGKWEEFWDYHEHSNEKGTQRNFSAAFKSLFQVLVSPLPQNRLSLKEIRASSWFNLTAKTVLTHDPIFEKKKKAITKSKIVRKVGNKKPPFSVKRALQ